MLKDLAGKPEFWVVASLACVLVFFSLTAKTTPMNNETSSYKGKVKTRNTIYSILWLLACLAFIFFLAVWAL